MAEQEALDDKLKKLTQREREIYYILWDYPKLTYTEISAKTGIHNHSLYQYNSMLKKKGYSTPQREKPTVRSMIPAYTKRYSGIVKDIREGMSVISLLGKYDINTRHAYIIHKIADKVGIPVRYIGYKQKLDEYFQTHREPDFENKI